MRSKVSRPLRKEFEAQLRSALPKFQRVRGAEIPPGCRLYEWNARNDLTVYIFLVLAPLHDEFYVEAAWSSKGEFPTFMIGMTPVDVPGTSILRDQPIENEFRFRIPELWPPFKDKSWRVTRNLGPADMPIEEYYDRDLLADNPDEFDPNLIKEQVEDAIDKIVAYAIPYIERETGMH